MSKRSREMFVEADFAMVHADARSTSVLKSRWTESSEGLRVYNLSADVDEREEITRFLSESERGTLWQQMLRQAQELDGAALLAQARLATGLSLSDS